MDRSFVSALERNLHCFVETLQAKNKLTNEIDIKCIKWGVTNSRMLDGKADGCSQWFLSILAWEKPIARRVRVIRMWTRFTSSELLLVYVQVQFLDFSIPRFSSITSLPFIRLRFLLAHVLQDYVLLV